MMCNPRVLLFCGRGDPPFLPVYQGPYSNNTPLSHRPTIGHYRVKMFRYRYRFFPLIQCTFSRTINNIICNTIFTRTACLYLSVMFRSHVRQCNTISRLVQSINQKVSVVSGLCRVVDATQKRRAHFFISRFSTTHDINTAFLSVRLSVSPMLSLSRTLLYIQVFAQPGTALILIFWTLQTPLQNSEANTLRDRKIAFSAKHQYEVIGFLSNIFNDFHGPSTRFSRSQHFWSRIYV